MKKNLHFLNQKFYLYISAREEDATNEEGKFIKRNLFHFW